MAYLRYREDIDEVYDRLTTWWNGGDIGRPVIQITAPREEPVEEIPEMPKPEGWVTDYSVSNYEYRLNLAARQCIQTHYLGEAVPFVSPDLAPNCLALYLGCAGVDHPGSVWCEPFIDDPASARFAFDPENPYWRFTLRLAEEERKMGEARFILQFPDLIEGLDTLAAMRDTELLLVDLIERPDWVHDSLGKITEVYFEYYDRLYEMIRTDRGGSQFWTWAPGRLSKLQCDFSAMISPAMFGEFMVPVLTEMSSRLDYVIYHWDGPGAIPHHDHLLSIDRIDVLQWTPGAGAESATDRQWWPLYHKTIERGKKVMTQFFESVDEIETFKREFGEGFKQFLIRARAETAEEARRMIEAAYL